MFTPLQLQRIQKQVWIAERDCFGFNSVKPPHTEISWDTRGNLYIVRRGTYRRVGHKRR